MAQKVVVRVLAMADDRTRIKAFETVADIYGVDAIAADICMQKLTVIGDMDPVTLVKRLVKRMGRVDVLFVGSAKEVETKEEEKEEKKIQVLVAKDDMKKEEKNVEKKEDNKHAERKSVEKNKGKHDEVDGEVILSTLILLYYFVSYTSY